MTVFCKLCKKPTTKFVESHIIPRWMYKFDKDWKVFSAYPNEYEKRSPTGPYGLFVCAGCEKIFQILDDYAAKILRKNPTPIHDSEGWNFGNYDYLKLKLFFLSVFWRVHVDDQYFSDINIGESANTIEQCLFNNSLYADDKFTLTIGYWRHPLAHGILPARSYRLSDNSIHWILYLPFFKVNLLEGLPQISEEYKPFVLNPDQPLLMQSSELTEDEKSSFKRIVIMNENKKIAYKKQF